MAVHRRALPLKVEGFPAGQLWFDWDDQANSFIILHPEIVILDENFKAAVDSYFGPVPLAPVSLAPDASGPKES